MWWGLPFGGTRGPALRLCHVWCIVVGIAFRRDARPRPTFVPRLMHCGGECFSAGHKAPPYGLCRVWCVAVGNAFRRDARPRPTGLAIIYHSSYSTPRPTGLCHDNAVMLRHTDWCNISPIFNPRGFDPWKMGSFFVCFAYKIYAFSRDFWKWTILTLREKLFII